jgi:hypothetical protein
MLQHDPVLCNASLLWHRQENIFWTGWCPCFWEHYSFLQVYILQMEGKKCSYWSRESLKASPPLQGERQKYFDELAWKMFQNTPKAEGGKTIAAKFLNSAWPSSHLLVILLFRHEQHNSNGWQNGGTTSRLQSRGRSFRKSGSTYSA